MSIFGSDFYRIDLKGRKFVDAPVIPYREEENYGKENGYLDVIGYLIKDKKNYFLFYMNREDNEKYEPIKAFKEVIICKRPKVLGCQEFCWRETV